MSAKTVVVLGAGVGGLVAANELRERLGREHRVVLIEKNAEHAFAPSFLWVMTGDRTPEEITQPLARLVRPGVEIVHSEARSLDLDARQVETAEGRIEYDVLIVALGAGLTYDPVPGLKEGAHTFYSLEGAIRLRDALRKFAGGTVAVVVAGLPYKCPGAPHEGAMLIRDVLRKRDLSDRTDVSLFTPEGQPMGVAGPELGQAVVDMLESRDIAFHPKHALTAVDPDARQLHFEGRDPVSYDLLVAIPLHAPSPFLREAGLANPTGWVSVNPQTLETERENVYAIGDIAAITIPGRWKSDMPLALPKAGVFAHGQAKVVASRIASEIAGTSSRELFRGEGYCMLEAGQGVAGFAYGDFYGEPAPQVHLRKMGKRWHVGKVLFEKWWLAPFGFRRRMLGSALRLGGKMFGVPVAP